MVKRLLPNLANKYNIVSVDAHRSSCIYSSENQLSEMMIGSFFVKMNKIACVGARVNCVEM